MLLQSTVLSTPPFSADSMYTQDTLGTLAATDLSGLEEGTRRAVRVVFSYHGDMLLCIIIRKCPIEVCVWKAVYSEEDFMLSKPRMCPFV
ncbi:hypothetical protein DMENIID0001_100210 [Sergentomyia squamirostris]